MEVSDTFYIDTEEELKRFCDRLDNACCIGLDTEFLREKTYYAQPCLLQVSGNGLIACIDPLMISDLGRLRVLLFDPGIVKILHACRQDIEILLQMFAAIPGPIFDTQLAAAFCGYGDQLSYAALVELLAGVTLPKAHTRARWCQRPLSDAEILYAEEDVRYLPGMYETLDRELARKGRKDWFEAEMSRNTDAAGFEIDNGMAWQRIGAIRALRGRSLQVAKQLAAWREDTARNRDKPRRWIMSDPLVVALAQEQPQTLQELAVVEGMTDGLLKHRGAQILTVIAEVGSVPPDMQAPVNVRPDAREKALSKALAVIIDDKATELDMPPSLLATRRDLMALVQGERALPVLQGWRSQLIGDALLEKLETGA
jgi:ribonuclease D